MSTSDLRVGAWLIEQPGWLVLGLEGPDRLPFLHKYCTQDVKGLEPGQGAYGCCLTVKGTMVADLWLLARADDALCLLTPAGAAALPGYLRKFALFDKVELKPRAELELLRVVGDGAAAALEQVTGVAPPSAPLGHRSLDWHGAVLVCDPYGAVPGWGLVLPVEARDAALAALEGAGIQRATPEAAERLRVEVGRPLFGVDMTEATIPIEAGLEAQAISYDKGCYIGQEVIARIAHRGHVNRHLRGFVLPADDAQAPPIAVFDDRKQVGQVTSVTTSPRGGRIGLGIVHRKRAEPGSEVFLGASDGPAATVAELPFAGGDA